MFIVNEVFTCCGMIPIQADDTVRQDNGEEQPHTSVFPGTRLLLTSIRYGITLLYFDLTWSCTKRSLTEVSMTKQLDAWNWKWEEDPDCDFIRIAITRAVVWGGGCVFFL